jgi:lysozyme
MSDVGKLRITKERAEELLEDDLREAKAAAAAITGLSSGPIFWAVTSFVFNLGPSALHGKSTQVGRHLINRDYTKAVLGMKRYVYGGGKKLSGLVKRRKEEGELIASIKTGHTNK